MLISDNKLSVFVLCFGIRAAFLRTLGLFFVSTYRQIKTLVLSLS